MKKIKFTCPHCEAKLRVPTHLAGVSAPCPKCGSTITAPSDITTAVVESPAERRSVNSVASSAPQRVRQQAGGTAVLEAPVSQVAAAGPAPAPVAPPLNPIAAVVNQPAPIEAKVVPSRPLPTPVPAARESDAAPAPVPAARPIPTPVPPSLEQPPALVPTPVPPALFVPPAPVSEAIPPMEDERSAPPALIENETAIVVEEHVYEMPPAPEPVSPLAPITQPIRVSAPAGDLPISRVNSSAPGSLPRLDVSLAGQDLAGAAAVLFGEGNQNQGRTRLVLPQPGAAVGAGNPGDFLVPPSAPAPVASLPLPPVPVPLTPPPATERVVHPWTEESVEDLAGKAIEETQPEYEEATLEPMAAVEPGLPIVAIPHYKTILLPNETAPLSLDELEGEEAGAAAWDEAAILENDAIFDPEGYLGEPPIDEWHGMPEELAVPALDLPEGYERDTAPAPRLAPPVTPPFPADWPEIETAPVPVPMGRAPFPPTPEEDTELPGNPLHEGSFGRLFAQQAPPDQIVPGPLGVGAGEAPVDPRETAESASEGDVLDELFYSSPRETGEKKRLSKTAIMAISTIVGVAIFAIVGVYFVINSFLGGFDPAEAYAEPAGGDSAAETAPGGTLAVKPKGVTVPTSVPDPGIGDAPAVIDPVAMLREGTAPANQAGNPSAAAPSDPPAVSFDEKVQQRVNGTRAVGASVIGAPSLDLEQTPATNFSGVIPPTLTNPPVAETPAPAPAGTPGIAEAAPPASATPPVAPSADALPMTAVEAANPGNAPAAAPRSVDPPVTKDPNYNPPASFAAPGPNDGALGKTRDLLDAFLRAPDWATRVNYVYQGESLRATIEDYHKKWSYKPFGRYSVQLYQMEADTSLGGPYWVFIVSTSDEEEGFPLIVRTENGLLKVDWEIFAEFSDRHFLQFREGTMAPPKTFRLIVERFSDYYGSDKDAFTDLKDYYVYQVNPPYGDLNEFSEFAFVKKDSPLAAQLDKIVRLGDEPLAVVITLDQKTFAHGVKHFVITELLTEGWFR